MARTAMVRALASFAAEIDGEELLISQGEVFPADHPVVRGREELFAPEAPVEQPTKAPGKKRKR